MGSGIAEVSAQGRRGRDGLRADRRADRPRAASASPRRWSAAASKGKLTETRSRRRTGEADVHHQPRRPGRPPARDRGGRRGRGRQGQDLRRTRRAHHRSRRRARVEHLQHPDHENRCGNEESEPRARPALLQSGAGAAAGRTDQHAGHHRRRRWRAPRSSRAACWASRWCAAATGRVHRQRAAGALPALGDPDGRSGRRHGRGHRQGRRRRARRTRWARCGCPISSGSTR